MYWKLLAILILAVAIDYFMFDGQYAANTSRYVQQIGRQLNGEVVRLLERGR